MAPHRVFTNPVDRAHHGRDSYRRHRAGRQRSTEPTNSLRRQRRQLHRVRQRFAHPDRAVAGWASIMDLYRHQRRQHSQLYLYRAPSMDGTIPRRLQTRLAATPRTRAVPRPHRAGRHRQSVEPGCSRRPGCYVHGGGRRIPHADGSLAGQREWRSLCRYPGSHVHHADLYRHACRRNESLSRGVHQRLRLRHDDGSQSHRDQGHVSGPLHIEPHARRSDLSTSPIRTKRRPLSMALDSAAPAGNICVNAMHFRRTSSWSPAALA